MSNLLWPDPFPGLSPPPNFKFLARAQKGSGNETSDRAGPTKAVLRRAGRETLSPVLGGLWESCDSSGWRYSGPG